MSHRSRLRSLALLSLLAVGVPLLATAQPTQAAGPAAVAPAAAAGAVAAPVAALAGAPTVDPAHPYSAPQYLPVQGARVLMDCYRSNQPQTCGTRDWQLNLLAAERGRDVYVPIHAMGAGRLSLRRVETEPCGSRTAGVGTQIEIDHGGGVVSRYGHLNNRDLALMRSLDGTLVAAGQKIGSMGTTGVKQASNCERNYIDFWLQRTPAVDKLEIKTLIACVAGEEQVWPGEMYPQYPTWNQLPKHIRPGVNTVLPTDDRQNEVPDASCLADGPPATPNRPAVPSLSPAGNDRVLVRWPAASGVSRTMVTVQVKRPEGWRTEGVSYVTGSPGRAYVGASSAVMTGRTVRVLLSQANGAGWSAVSAPSAERKVGAAPAAPRLRSLRAVRSGATTTIILGWRSGAVRGYPATGWVAEIRRAGGPWRAVNLPRSTYTKRYTGLTRGTRYAVRVKARSAAGFSGYLTRGVTTPR